MERNFEAEAAEMRVTEADRWEAAQHMWDLAHEGQSDNYVPDEPEPDQEQKQGRKWWDGEKWAVLDHDPTPGGLPAGEPEPDSDAAWDALGFDSFHFNQDGQIKCSYPGCDRVAVNTCSHCPDSWCDAHGAGHKPMYPEPEPEPDQEQEQTPTGDRYYPTIAAAITEACRDWQYWDLGGMDGPDPYAELQAALQRAVEEVQSLRGHEHQWTEQDYCSICGRDGRV